MDKLVSFRRLLCWLLPYWRGYGWHAAINAAMGILTVLLNLGFVAGTRLTIDIATGVTQRFTLNTALLLLGAIMVLQILVSLANRWIKAVLGVRAQNAMQERMYRHILGSDWLTLKAYHSGDVMNRLLKDVGSLVNLLTQDIPDLLTTLFQFAGAFLFLYYLDQTLALLLIIIAPFFLIISKLYVRRLRRLTHEVRDTESRVQSQIQESIQHALVVKTLGRAAWMLERLTQTHRHLRSTIVQKTVYSSLSATLLNIGFATGYLVTFSWGVKQLQAEAITYGALIAFIQLVGQIQGPLRTLSQYVPVFVSASTACERLMELDSIPSEQLEATMASTAAADERSQHLGLSVEAVDYAYGSKGRQILTQFSYDFPVGSVTAILGETGAGKTTLVRLLLGLMRPQQGRILMRRSDGTAWEIGVNDRVRFSYVPQGNTLLSGTIRENLQLGNPTATEEEMVRALRDAAADFVFDLPLQLDTPCTENGGGLSEGQAQRISIARALLHDAPFMLFDESTSALDAKTEERVVKNIIGRCQGKTLIFITHRPSVLAYCTQQLHLTR